MVRNNSVLYHFIYAGNLERILKIYNNKEEVIDNKSIIGTCFCSIVNDKDKIIALKQEFNKTYMNKYTDKIKLLDIKEIIDLTYNKLVSVNSYFTILYNKFNKISNESQKTNIFKDFNELDKQYYHFTKESLIKQRLKYYNDYIKNIENILDTIINTITSFEDIYSNHLALKKIKVPSCSMTLISDDSTKKYRYVYSIYTLNDLLSISFYILCSHPYILKRCRYCGKFFIARDNRNKDCENPCPDYPSLTCRQAKRRGKVGDSFYQPDWRVKLNELEPDRKNSIQFFTDNISRTKNARKIEMLKRNKEIFTSTTKDLHFYIRKSKKEDKYKYLKIYEKFINDVRENQKHSPPIFKVKKPKY